MRRILGSASNFELKPIFRSRKPKQLPLLPFWRSKCITFAAGSGERDKLAGG
jgi:hypothetical protein